MERRSGVALWRQIADAIRRDIAEGGHQEGARMPAEIDLAARFGVNRHTIRAAIAALVRDGVLRAEQGRGTFVEHRRRIAYPIGKRTRFSAGLEGQARQTRIRLIDHGVEAADREAAQALGLDEGAPVIRLRTVSEADGTPIGYADAWFDAVRLAGFGEDFAETGSVTATLARHGITDYLRHTTRVTARHADSAVLDHLALSPGAIVIVTTAINVDPNGQPIEYARTQFAADRVELTIGLDRLGSHNP